MINRDKFFPAVRAQVFGGTLTQPQVDGINAILDAWEASGLTDLRWLAYMLATAFWETARTMQPIKEYGGNAYYTKLYDVTGDYPDRARRMGNTEPGDGPRYCGRGYPQLTWKSNYAKMSPIVGVDLVADPDRAMEPAIAIAIMFEGMVRGMYTGVGLSRYFDADTEDWVNARRIINGLDHAQEIAGTARAFHAALQVA
jgi:putative chitinase